jgi:hypothetical protein
MMPDHSRNRDSCPRRSGPIRSDPALAARVDTALDTAVREQLTASRAVGSSPATASRVMRLDNTNGIARVPAVVYSEHNPFANPHFDRSGGDTFARIDMAYRTSIARPAITFQAMLAGVQPPVPGSRAIAARARG